MPALGTDVKSTEATRLWWGGSLLALSGLAWGGMFPVVKAVLTFIDPFTFAFIRHGLTAVIFLAILAVVEGPRNLACGKHKLRVWALGTIGFGGYGLLAFIGLQNTRAEHAAVIMALLPLITILVNWGLRGVRPSVVSAVCIAVGIAGVALVVTDGNFSSFAAGNSAIPDLMVVLGAVCWVFYTLGRSTVSDWSTLRYTALTCVYSVSSLAVAAAIVWWLGDEKLPTMVEVKPFASALAYTVILASVIAVLSWNVGINIVGPSKGVLFINLVPVTAFAIAVAQGRTPDVTEIVGVVLVIVALVANSSYTPRS